MTEQEAKSKWCPMARVPFYNANSVECGPVVAGNMGAAPSASMVTCIGSACMMWRYNLGWRFYDQNGWQWARLGRCGLAGKP